MLRLQEITFNIGLMINVTCEYLVKKNGPNLIKEIGTKNQTGESGGKRKKILARTLKCKKKTKNNNTFYD